MEALGLVLPCAQAPCAFGSRGHRNSAQHKSWGYCHKEIKGAELPQWHTSPPGSARGVWHPPGREGRQGGPLGNREGAEQGVPVLMAAPEPGRGLAAPHALCRVQLQQVPAGMSLPGTLPEHGELQCQPESTALCQTACPTLTYAWQGCDTQTGHQVTNLGS